MKKIICWLFGHELLTVHYCSNYSEKLVCTKCKRYYGMNHDVRVFIPWNEGLKLDTCDHN